MGQPSLRAPEDELFDEFFELRKRSFFYSGRRRILERLLSPVILRRGLAGRAESLRIADIGSGPGSELLVKMLKEAGIDRPRITGIDINLHTLLKISGKRVGGTGLVNADILALPFKRRFDIVMLLDVLEHVEDDRRALGNVYDICRDDALIVITVPAVRSMYGEFDRIARHKRRYDMGELRGKLQKAGFEILKSSYFIFFLLPFIYAYRLIRQWAIDLSGRKKMGLDEAMENKVVPVINDLCLHTLLLESMMIGKLNFPIGSSIVAIARKRPGA